MKTWWAVGSAAALISLVALVSSYMRCHAPPLARDEALARGSVVRDRFLREFKLNGPTPTLMKIEREPDSAAWLLTYKSESCSLIVVVDRCHGDEVGSASACR